MSLGYVLCEVGQGNCSEVDFLFTFTNNSITMNFNKWIFYYYIFTIFTLTLLKYTLLCGFAHGIHENLTCKEPTTIQLSPIHTLKFLNSYKKVNKKCYELSQIGCSNAKVLISSLHEKSFWRVKTRLCFRSEMIC